MVSREQLTGKWDQVQGQLLKRWGELTEDTLDQVKGNTQQLVGVIHEKTGVAREEIEQFIDHSIANAHSMYDDASQIVEDQWEYAQGMIRKRPMESLGIALGAGVLTGLLVGFVLYPRD